MDPNLHFYSPGPMSLLTLLCASLSPVRPPQFADRQHTRMLLADFGIALSLRQERAVTRAGTTEYMSPEQLRCPFKRHPSDNKDRTDLHYGLGVDGRPGGEVGVM